MVKKQLTSLILLAIVGATVAGCGQQPGTRALSGGAIGAGSGAILGAATGIGPGAGAAIGGSVGAVAGAAIKSSTLDLGKPLVGN